MCQYQSTSIAPARVTSFKSDTEPGSRDLVALIERLLAARPLAARGSAPSRFPAGHLANDPGCVASEFDAEWRVVHHCDYTDAADELYAKLPLVGPLMRFLREADGVM